MRHRVYGKKLGRNKNERNSLFRSLMQELFLRGTITTSTAKASAIKGQVDKVINMAKGKNSQNLQSIFSNKLLTDRIIKEIAPKLSARNSGYTSLIKIGIQKGDNTKVVKMSLIGLEQLKPLEKPAKKEMVEKDLTTKKVEPIKKTVSKPTVKKSAPAKKASPKKKVSKK